MNLEETMVFVHRSCAEHGVRSRAGFATLASAKAGFV